MWPFKKRSSPSNKSDNANMIPMEYYETVQHEIKPIENLIVQCRVSAINSKRVEDKIRYLAGCVKAYENLREKCISLGNEYEKYFNDMWEHCHNSINPDFSYIDPVKTELKDLQLNYGELVIKQSRYDHESINLKSRVFELVKDNPGIKQTEIYKRFDSLVKNDVQSMLYFMEKDGIIKREKQENSYKVFALRNVEGK